MDKRAAFARVIASFEGQRGLYLEHGYLCVVEVRQLQLDVDGLSASVVWAARDRLIARIRRVRHAGELRATFSGEPCPFGETWEIRQRWETFWFDELEAPAWNGSLQGGWRSGCLGVASPLPRYNQRPLAMCLPSASCAS